MGAYSSKSGVLLAALVLAPVGCGNSGADGETPDGTGPDAAPTDAVLPDGGGSGSISGSADGTPFMTVATAYLAGAPDTPSTTVVFVFSKPVPCADLGSVGWDKRIANATQFLELKMFGKDPGTFAAVSTVTPAAGEVSVNYTLSSTSGTPNEVPASGGSVTLTSLVAGTSAAGSFALKFGSNSLSGSFSAVNCPGGHEP